MVLRVQKKDKQKESYAEISQVPLREGPSQAKPKPCIALSGISFEPNASRDPLSSIMTET